MSFFGSGSLAVWLSLQLRVFAGTIVRLLAVVFTQSRKVAKFKPQVSKPNFRFRVTGYRVFKQLALAIDGSIKCFPNPVNIFP